MRYDAVLNVNGTDYPVEIEPGRSLLSVVRTELGLAGSKEGCDDSECGACMMLLDGRPVNSCSYLAVQADGREVTTIEGISANGELHPMQQAFHENHALQCGYCTPGMVMTAIKLLEHNPSPSDDEIRHGLEGNLCRCTGYMNIVAAVRAAAGVTA
jgi:carbon-monoxide dehydrogenase small subunit